MVAETLRKVQTVIFCTEHINSTMHEKGMKFDLNNLRPDDIEELIRNLADREVNVKSKNGDTVRVYCGE